jgi:general secretion pathway protein M
MGKLTDSMTGIASTLATSAAGETVIGRYRTMEERDRLALKILACFLGVIFLVYLLLIPAWQHATDGRTASSSARAALAWMQANEALARSLPDTSNSADEGDLLATSAELASRAGIQFQRYEQAGDGGLRLWISAAPFSQLLNWIGELDDSHGIGLEQISIERSDENGVVSAVIILRG